MPKKALEGFVEILHKGDFDLVYKYSVNLKPAAPVDSYGSGGASDTPEYTKQIDVFYSKDGKTLEPLKGKKELLALFGDKSSKMKAYTKENKVKLREFDSMQAMIAYYQSL